MHEPVLLKEVLEYLSPRPGDLMIDATAGGGGHAEAILQKITPGGKLIAVDKDPAALERTGIRLKAFGDSFDLVRSDYKEIDRIVKKGVGGLINGAVFDLGVSSFHLDEPERGFSFRKDGPLDMRMDTESGLTAADVVNRLRRADLEYIISRYGEERHAARAARAIVEYRERDQIKRTGQLEALLYKALIRYYRGQKLHPATRTFQALRIYVNDELGALETALERLPGCMASGGRACFISFHSLEDRTVKRAFKDLKEKGIVKIVTKKPVVPGIEERKENPRSRSAKLRVAERI